jgi:hypothetical protein
MMTLTVYGEKQAFIAIQDFRMTFGLPEHFGMALFEPKDFTGLGQITHADVELRDLRQTVLDALPTTPPPQGWMAFMLDLQLIFLRKLRAVNLAFGLKQEEIDFTVSGFGDVCRAFTYAALRAQIQRNPAPDFWQIYGEWLNDSLLISRTFFRYEHSGEMWKIQTLRHFYGRIGLIVHTANQTYYVQDNSLSCPAEDFMASLLYEIAQRVQAIID